MTATSNLSEISTIKLNTLTSQLKKIGKGRQSKWLVNDTYYKADNEGGCEGLAEVIVSDMLKKSNLDRYFTYEPVKITVGKHIYSGCSSPNGLYDGERLVTTYQLLKKAKTQFFTRIENEFDYGTPKEYLTEFVNEIKRLTNIQHFGEYMKKTLELDAITLNDDRHFNNICVIYNTKTRIFEPGPIFDNGHSFSLWHYSSLTSKNAEEVAEKIEAMPFSHMFNTQRDIAQKLYGGMYLKLEYSRKDLEKTLEKCEAYYDQDVLDFAKKMCEMQMDRYADYFFTQEREEWKHKIQNEVENNFSIPVSFHEEGHDFVISPDNMDFSIHTRPSGFVQTNDTDDTLFDISCKYGNDVFEMYRAIANTVQEESRRKETRYTENPERHSGNTTPLL